MSRKHAELEREFIDELANRTGRTLDEWMAAIDGSGIADRNAIIDWLRPQGLTFAHASWLERIHHNAGRPIYLGTVLHAPPPFQIPANSTSTPPPAAPRPTATRPPSAPQSATSATTPPIQIPPPKAPAIAHGSPSGDTITNLLARGKGLKPLADLVLREIARAVPGTTTAASGELLVFANPGPYGCLHIAPKELRLGLALPGTTPPTPVQPQRIPGAPPCITHMHVLNDARQVDSALIQLVVLASGKTSPT